MGNAFLDIHTDTDFTPYVGGGLGAAYLNDHVTVSSGFDTKDKIWNFAWNVGGGVAWSLNESMALDLGYRYMDMGKTDGSLLGPGSHSTTTDLTAHEFSLGLRISGF
jgi:opacity protein-like surface antigen